MKTINELIVEYPDIDWDEVHRSTLIEIAERYLSSERRKLYADTPRVSRNEEDSSVILERRIQAQRQRKREKTVEVKASERAKVNSAVSNRINEITRTYAATIFNTWLPDLLDSTFALPDGTRVRWADATVTQHEERAGFLEKQASENTKTASMHRRAVDDIRKTGAENLSKALNR